METRLSNISKATNATDLIKTIFEKVNRHFQFSISQIFWQKFFVSKNLKCKDQLLWKLRTVELAILFHWT